VSEKRGAVPAGLEGGVVVHDHFKPDYGLTGLAHAYCNAHHLRELKALIEFDAEPWAKDMRDLLVEANDAVRKARQQDATALAPPAVAGFVTRCAAIAFGRRCGTRPEPCRRIVEVTDRGDRSKLGDARRHRGERLRLVDHPGREAGRAEKRRAEQIVHRLGDPVLRNQLLDVEINRRRPDALAVLRRSGDARGKIGFVSVPHAAQQ
jgi:hypothetical protein